jgi:ArsR family transcriptional regulator
MALLGDPARVRLLRLLGREELGVGELARVVQLPQSTVSRHLKALLDARWIARRVEGTASLYRLAALEPAAHELWELARRSVERAAAVSSDDRRLVVVLAERRADTKAFFGRIGGEWSSLRSELFGRQFNDEALLGLLDPALCIADLGCGTGEVAECLAPFVRRVIAVDREESMLAAARTRLAGAANVEFRKGDLLALPCEAGEVDVAVISLVLHHLPQPAEAVAEAGRVLAPGGRLLVIDMLTHDRESWRQTMGHQHLGFSQEDVRAWASAEANERTGAWLSLRRFRPLRPDSDGKGPGLFAALLIREQSLT